MSESHATDPHPLLLHFRPHRHKGNCLLHAGCLHNESSGEGTQDSDRPSDSHPCTCSNTEVGVQAHRQGAEGEVVTQLDGGGGGGGGELQYGNGRGHGHASG